MVIRDEQGRVLLVHTAYGDQFWEIPGGGLGPCEHPEDAAVREVAEEIGLEPALGPLLAIDLFLCTLPDGQAALLGNWVFDGGVVDDRRRSPARLRRDRRDAFLRPCRVSPTAA